MNISGRRRRSLAKPTATSYKWEVVRSVFFYIIIFLHTTEPMTVTQWDRTIFRSPKIVENILINSQRKYTIFIVY